MIANSSNDFQEKIKNIHNSVVQLENSIDLKDVMDNFDNLSKLINRAGSEVEQFSSALDHTTNTIKNSTSSLSSLTTVDDANLQK